MADILCFGDSITKGNDDASGGWPQRVNNSLRSIYVDERGSPKHNVYNLGVDGDTSEGLLARVEHETVARSTFSNPIALIMIGTNDSASRDGKQWVPGDKYTKNLSHILKITTELCQDVLVMSLLPCIDDMLSPSPWVKDEEIVYSTKSLQAYSAAAQKVSQQTGVDFCDIFNIFGDLDLEVFLHDGLHPNSVGQQYIADRVKKWVATKANNFDRIDSK